MIVGLRGDLITFGSPDENLPENTSENLTSSISVSGAFYTFLSTLNF